MASNVNKTANRQPLGIPQTRGKFEVCGKVTRRDESNFYTQGTTRDAKPYRSVSFGVQFDRDKTIFVRLFGMPQESVYFSKSDQVNGKRETVTQAVAWQDRLKFREEGYRMIGITCGCSRKIDPKTGNERNDVKTLTPYDACEEMLNLKDGDSVYVRGDISYSEYNDRKRTDFEIKQVSLCKPIDFDDPAFTPRANFQQKMVIVDIQKSEENPEETSVLGEVVGYNSIDDAEFFVRNPVLARTLQKKLKPYMCIEVYGDIDVETNQDTVEVDDEWGTTNPMRRQRAPQVRKMIITGADPDSIDEETYSQEAMENAFDRMFALRKAKDEFGGRSKDRFDESWGSTKPSRGNAGRNSGGMSSTSESYDDYDMEALDDFIG